MEAVVAQLADLANEGRDIIAVDEKGGIAQILGLLEPETKQDAQANWTSFLNLVVETLLQKRISARVVSGVVSRMFQNSIMDCGGLLCASAKEVDALKIPDRCKDLLPECKALLEHRQKMLLISKENVKENSRLIVEKRGDAVTKISFAADKSPLVTVWEKPTTTVGHNLQSTDLPSREELGLLGTGESTGTSDAAESAESESPDLSTGDFADVSDQFDGCLLQILIDRINDKDAWKTIKDLASHGENTGEMLFQQAVYPAFTLVLLAASDDPRFVYLADQEVLSSSFVTLDTETHIVNGKPDAGLCLPSKDPLALVEIKPDESLNHHDLAKCILWSSIAGQALLEIGVERTKVRVPFLIGSGFLISLYVTSFPNTEEDQYCPSVACVCNTPVSLLEMARRKEVFVDFVRMVGNLKRAVRATGKICVLRDRRKTKVAWPNLFSSDTKRRKTVQFSDDEGDEDRTDDRRVTDASGAAESSATMAVLRACPEASDLRFPWQRYSCLFHDDRDEDSAVDYHQRQSPFYFRGKISGSCAFFKVWRLDDEVDVEKEIQEEVRFLQRAHVAGVSVPSVFHQGESLAVDGSRYFVLAMSDAGICHRVANYDELVLYSRSLIQNTEKLHSQAGILQCDIKPDNIVWDGAKGEVTMLDFGHAQEEKRAVCIRGTEGFVAPEVRLRDKVNTRASDAYSVGATLRFLSNTLVSAEPNSRGDTDKYSRFGRVIDALVSADPLPRMTLKQALDELMAIRSASTPPSRPFRKKFKAGKTDRSQQLQVSVA